MQLPRLLLNIMLLCILATVIVGATWKNALPDQSPRVERRGHESIRPTGQPGWEPVSKPRYILASGTPTVPTPTQPPPTPTQPPPCTCPSSAPTPGALGASRCGDDCTTAICTWDTITPDVKICVERHEDVHLLQPDQICVSGGYVGNSTTESLARSECAAWSDSVGCVATVNLAPDDPNYSTVQRLKKASYESAKYWCDRVNVPPPTPIPGLVSP